MGLHLDDDSLDRLHHHRGGDDDDDDEMADALAKIVAGEGHLGFGAEDLEVLTEMGWRPVELEDGRVAVLDEEGLEVSPAHVGEVLAEAERARRAEEKLLGLLSRAIGVQSDRRPWG